MNKSMNKFWFYWDSYGIFGILFVTVIVFALLNPVIVSPNNLLTVLSRSAITGIAACGMTFAICSGGFDLSVGATLSLATCLFAANVTSLGMVPSVLITLAVSIFFGICNGLVITKLKIQTFVATLAMGMIIKGVALLYTAGSKQIIDRDISPEAKFFSQNVNLTAELQIQLVPLLLTLAAFGLGFYVYKRTRFGVHVRSIGSNETASRTSGLKVDKTLIIVFALTSFTAAISGLIRTSQLMQGHAQLGDGFELEAITATILGGTSLAGGKGNIWGSLIGAVMLTLVRSGLNILGLNDEYQRLAIGLILLLALSISGIRELTKEAGV